MTVRPHPAFASPLWPGHARAERGCACGGIGRGGTFSVEFALVVPVLALLVLSAIEFGTQQMTATLLDSGARDASRFGITGALVPPGMEGSPPKSREEAIRRIILQRGQGWLVDGLLEPVKVTAYGGHAAIGSPLGSAGAGGGGQVVVYELAYRAPLHPILATLLGRDFILHQSRSIVRNEPFGAS